VSKGAGEFEVAGKVKPEGPRTVECAREFALETDFEVEGTTGTIRVEEVVPEGVCEGAGVIQVKGETESEVERAIDVESAVQGEVEGTGEVVVH
jgi:hypothetical protein